ncbi:hypothetical protein K8R32_02500 [bacterium]|nr:hypothetical protein [bacterium]
MSEKQRSGQLGKMMGRLVEHQSEFFELTTEQRQWVIENPKEAIACFMGSIRNRFKPTDSLLDSVGEVSIPGSTKSFIAREHFIVGQKVKMPVSYLGDDFCSWFLDKVEDGSYEKSVVHYSRLLKRASVDRQIVTELGGEREVEIRLYEMFFLMELQSNGEDGILITNGLQNIFYILDSSLVLRAVNIGWGGSGWNISALNVETFDKWDAGAQVFSRRNSLII